MLRILMKNSTFSVKTAKKGFKYQTDGTGTCSQKCACAATSLDDGDHTPHMRMTGQGYMRRNTAHPQTPPPH